MSRLQVLFFLYSKVVGRRWGRQFEFRSIFILPFENRKNENDKYFFEMRERTALMSINFVVFEMILYITLKIWSPFWMIFRPQLFLQKETAPYAIALRCDYVFFRSWILIPNSVNIWSPMCFVRFLAITVVLFIVYFAGDAGQPWHHMHTCEI